MSPIDGWLGGGVERKNYKNKHKKRNSLKLLRKEWFLMLFNVVVFATGQDFSDLMNAHVGAQLMFTGLQDRFQSPLSH